MTYFGEKNFKLISLSYIVIFSILYLCSGFAISSILGGSVIFAGCIALSFALFLAFGKWKIGYNLLIAVSLMILNLCITTILRDDGIKQFIIYSGFIFVATLLAHVLKDSFNILFVKLMYFLAIFSLALWLSFIVAPSMVRRLPEISNQYGLRAYTAFFATIYPSRNMSLPRNQGIFWEAGAYQAFVNLALAISGFSHEFENRRIKYFLVFGLTILTTFSTTGYIVCGAILLTYCLNEVIKSKSRKVLVKYLTLIVAVMLIFAVIYSCLPYDAQVQIFGKFKYYLINKNKLSSTSIRVNSVKIAVQNFMDHPIFGCGTSYFNEMQTDPTILLTCTPLNFFAYYGIFFGIIANLGLWMYAKSLVGNNLVSFALFCCFTLSTISQNFMRDPIFLTVIFLGILKYRWKSKGLSAIMRRK